MNNDGISLGQLLDLVDPFSTFQFFVVRYDYPVLVAIDGGFLLLFRPPSVPAELAFSEAED